MLTIDKVQVDKIIDGLLGNNDLTASPEVWYGLHQIKKLPVTEIITCGECRHNGTHNCLLNLWATIFNSIKMISFAERRKGEPMTNKEAVNWLINITADIGKTEHRDLWHYEQALTEIKDMLESEQPEIVRCGECVYSNKEYSGEMWCGICNGFGIDEDSFCSFAERRTDADT